MGEPALYVICTVKCICTMGLRMILTAGDCGGKVRTSSRVDGAGRLEGWGGHHFRFSSENNVRGSA